MSSNTKNNELETQLAVMGENIKRIDNTLLSFDRKLEKLADNLVSQNDFKRLESQVEKHDALLDDLQNVKGDISLVKKIVYGAVGTTLTSVLVAVLYLVIN